MKFVVTLAMLMTSITTYASQLPAYCHQTARMAAVQAALTEFPNDIPAATKVEFESYSGWHQKQYIVEIPFKTVKDTEYYEVRVFEFESPDTDCEVASITRITQ